MAIMLVPVLPLLRRRSVVALVALLFAALVLVRRSSPMAMPTQWQSSDWSWVAGLGPGGAVPMRRYHSFDHDSIDLRFHVRDERRCSHEQLFLATRGSSTEPGAVILDHTGELVWRQSRMADEIHDFRVQTYKGQRFLTFWAGKPDGGGKQGSWYMMDDSYTIRYNISAPGFRYGDMHEFSLTSRDTALITIYNPVRGDLSAFGGSATGWFLDGVFQEIDIQSKKVLFQWKSSDHIPLNTTAKSLKACSDDPRKAFLGCGNTSDAAFDYYHINSVQRDKKGNYLVSGRHTSSLTYIDGKSGQPLWHMGGRQNQFRYTPLGTKLLFAWQHHAHIFDDGTITLLDNNAYNPKAEPTESRGLRLRADFTSMTVSLEATFRPSQQIMAFSQGSVQILDSGNVFVGWGSSAAFTEFSAAGEVLCDAVFAPPALFISQPVSSYRTYRGTWTGKPRDEPRIATTARAIYVSWNGATEVSSWRLQGKLHGSSDGDGDGDRNNDGFETIAEIPKVHFETEFPTRNLTKTYARLRMQAVDVGGHTLGTTAAIEPPSRLSLWIGALGLLAWLGLGALLVFCCAGCVAGVGLCRRGSRRSSSATKYKGIKMDDL